LTTLTVTVDEASLDRLAESIARRLGSSPTTSATTSVPPPEAPETDPWDAPWPSQATDGGSVPASPVASQAAQSAPPPPVQPGTVTVNTKNGPQQWTLGAANAPACKHGQPAAYVQGFTNGKPWKRWTCALGAGDGWRNKCDFSQWA
jgi:hypothetical protein